MKVIAKKSSDVYLCEVSHTEIEKFMNLYYNNRKRLEVGEFIDLSKGHDFYGKTRVALTKTEEFFKAHESTVKAIADGFLLMTKDTPQVSDAK